MQEGKEKCYEKWNIPAGHLDCKETIEQGAIREIKEETGCDVKLTGILNIANRVMENDILVCIVFQTELLKETIQYDKKEILDVKWYDIEDVIHKMDTKLRDLNFIKQPILNLIHHKIGTMDILQQI